MKIIIYIHFIIISSFSHTVIRPLYAVPLCQRFEKCACVLRGNLQFERQDLAPVYYIRAAISQVPP